jgi:hypothetical protein
MSRNHHQKPRRLQICRQRQQCRLLVPDREKGSCIWRQHHRLRQTRVFVVVYTGIRLQDQTERQMHSNQVNNLSILLLNYCHPNEEIKFWSRSQKFTLLFTWQLIFWSLSWHLLRIFISLLLSRSRHEWRLPTIFYIFTFTFINSTKLIISVFLSSIIVIESSNEKHTLKASCLQCWFWETTQTARQS